ncbi:MAG: DUF2142 domain-containing protein, partial [Acidimicrobiia bacterium]|nr:DUF2142 domain-containing protein [Acidimicrobiia bacterium]
GRSLAGWAAFGAGGTVLAATRSVGPYFVVALGVLALLFGGARRVREATRARPWAAVVAGTCIAVAALANLAWEAAKQPHLTWGSVLDHATLGRLPSLGKELVGRFGILEWGLPWPIYALWGALVLVLVVAALVVGTWRQRAALAGLVALNVVLAIAFHSVLPAQTGFDVQGRYILPLAVGIPIVAAEIVHRRQRAGRVLVAAGAATGVVVAGLQFLAWYLNGRRYAVGTSGPRWFLGRAQWTPTGGWLAWLAVAAAGAVCLLAAAGTSLAPEALSRSRRRRSEPVATIAASA